MSTLIQLRTRVKARFRDTNNAIYSDGEWNDYINDAYTDVMSESAYWPFSRQINRSVNYPAQATSIFLPTDAAVPAASEVFRVTEVLNVTDRYPLAPLFGAATVAAAYPYADTAFGNPIHYVVYNNTLELYPRPLAAVTLSIRYSDMPVVLAADGDIPAFPSQYHSLLIYGALRYAYMDDGNVQAAQAHQQDFQDTLEDMKSDLLSTQAEVYPVIQDVWEWL